jgi:hypothetical protein
MLGDQRIITGNAFLVLQISGRSLDVALPLPFDAPLRRLVNPRARLRGRSSASSTTEWGIFYASAEIAARSFIDWVILLIAVQEDRVISFW